MEHLRHGLDELQESYGELVEASAKAANWAEAADTYRGSMFHTVDPGLLDVPDAEARFEEAFEKAYRQLSQTEDDLYRLSGDIQAYMDGRTDMPEELVQIDGQMGDIREWRREIEEELKIIEGRKTPEDDIRASDVRHCIQQAQNLQEGLQE